MSDIQIFDAHTTEIKCILKDFQDAANGKTGDELLAIRRAENAALADAAARQGRVLAFMAGEPIEPQTHFGEAVLLPQFGGG